MYKILYLILKIRKFSEILWITLKIYATRFVELVFEVFSSIHLFSVNDPQRNEFVNLLRVRPRKKKMYPTKIIMAMYRKLTGVGGISFMMITKQGSLSIIKTISKTKAAHFRLGRTRVVPRHQDARNSRRFALANRVRNYYRTIPIVARWQAENAAAASACLHLRRRTISLYCNIV
jgi:hypothetical protein